MRVRYLGFLSAAAIVAIAVLAMACNGAAATATPAPTKAPAPTAVPATTPSAVPTARPAPTATQAPQADKPVRGGTIRFPLTLSLDAPDPAYSTQTGTRNVMLAIFDNLTEFTPTGPISPGLARSWDFSADGKTITFHLAQNVTFTDGTKLDAAAVKWNFDRYLDPTVGSARKTDVVPPLTSVEVVDSATVRFQLSAPFRPLLAALTQQAGLMASPAAVQKLNSYANRNGDFGRTPVGSGPFKLKEWVVGTKFSFVRNETYWQSGLPYADAIEMPIIGDQQIQFAMLRTGEVDVMERLPAGMVDLALRNPDIKLMDIPGASTQVMVFRVNAKPFDNKLLRQAFAWAADRDAVGQIVFGGRAQPAQSLISPADGPWYDPTVQVYKRDVQKAKSLLAQAGYPNGFSFNMPCRPSGSEAQTCELLQVSLADIGVTMNIQLYDTVNYFTDFVAKKHDGPLATFFSARPDPGINIRRLYHSKGASNSWGYSNPQLDQLIEQVDTIYDVAQAKQVYNKILNTLADEGPFIYLSWWNTTFGLRNNVRNFTTVSDALLRFRDVWLAK